MPLNVWLKIEDVARLEGIGYSTVARYVNQKQYRTCKVPSPKQKGKEQTKIFLFSLSPKAAKQYIEENFEAVTRLIGKYASPTNKIPAPFKITITIEG